MKSIFKLAIYSYSLTGGLTKMKKGSRMKIRQNLSVPVVICAVALTAGCSNSTPTTLFGGATATSTRNNPNSKTESLRRESPVKPNTYGVVYSFPKQSNGAANPAGPLSIASGGIVYGTTVDNWVNGCGECGDGAVYEFSNGSGSFSLVHDFNGGDGYSPETGVIQDSSGALYGTAPIGGSGSFCYSSSYGCGVLFKLTKSGSTWTIHVLHDFGNSSSDGQYPSGPLLLIGSNLYGVTNVGGTGSCYPYPGCGTIYKIGTSGSSYTTLHDFAGGVNHYPDGPLATDGSGHLYGTTVFGGSGSCDSGLGCGAVYSISTGGSGFTALYSFTGIDNGDGASPESGVTVVGVNLFGTTATGGKTGCAIEGNNPAGCGVIFELFGNDVGAYTESVIRKFDPANGQSPIPSGLLAANSTDLYGTTSLGGNCTVHGFPNGCGLVFEITTSGSYSIVHKFQGPTADGAYPNGGTPAGKLVAPPSGSGSINPDFSSAGSGAALGVDTTGTLWGATFNGGSGACPSGCGVIYQLTNGSGSAHRRH